MIKNLLKILNLKDLEEEDQVKISSEVEELLEEAVFNYILAQLSDDDARKFLSLIETPEQDSQTIFVFLKEKIPLLEEKLIKEVKKEIDFIKNNYGRD